MTDEKNSISRRNVLGGLGAIGVGGALAGAGTSAFFSDKENFDGNKLVTGALDLKVDWQEHYSDWSKDELEGLTYDVVMEDPESEEYVGFPTQAEEYLLWVHEDDVDQFMRNTAIEAFPDVLNPDTEEYDALQADFEDKKACKILGSIDDPHDPVLYSDLRTQGTFGGSSENGSNIEYPNPQTTSPGDPLINIKDIKPGDFGELTLSFHLCDNPGYVWLTGTLREALENGFTEPEKNDPDEEEGIVELLDEILVQFWLDNYEGNGAERGDNIYQDEETLLFPEPLTLREALNLLETGDGGLGLPLQPDSSGDGAVFGPGTCPEEDFDNVLTGQETFPDGTMREQMNPFCSDFDPALVEALKVEDVDLPDSGMETYETEYGDIQITTSDRGTITSWVTDATPDGELDDEDGFCVSKVIVKGGQDGANIYSYDVDSDGSSGDEGMFTTPTGQDISNVKFCVELKEQPNGDRECFVNSTTQYVGFSWWLPVDHANEIQTDSVKFDLGFYTEQCRHNDGSGMKKRKIATETGTGFVDAENSFATPSPFGRSRYGGTNTWELAAGENVANVNSGTISDAEYDWASKFGQQLPFILTYDGNNEIAYTFDGKTVTRSNVDAPDGRLGITARVNEASIEISNLRLFADGSTKEPEQDSLSVSNDDGASGRNIRWLLLNTDVSQLDDGFTLTGTATIDIQGDFPGGEEDFAFDVVME